jgi:hypothetical protein
MEKLAERIVEARKRAPSRDPIQRRRLGVFPDLDFLKSGAIIRR